MDEQRTDIVVYPLHSGSAAGFSNSLDMNCGYILGFFLEVAERSTTVQSHLVALGFGSRGMNRCGVAGPSPLCLAWVGIWGSDLPPCSPSLPLPWKSSCRLPPKPGQPHLKKERLQSLTHVEVLWGLVL